MSYASNFFTRKQQKTILEAIRVAEQLTGGEIRVHIDSSCPGDALDRATHIFEKLKMHKTELRNGVLFYLAVLPRKFAVIGDAGINAVVPDGFWDAIKSHLQLRFSEQNFTEGLCEAIAMVGEQLKAYFPFQTDDKNELPDEISFQNE